jgi:hypothetical protein
VHELQNLSSGTESRVLKLSYAHLVTLRHAASPRSRVAINCVERFVTQAIRVMTVERAGSEGAYSAAVPATPNTTIKGASLLSLGDLAHVTCCPAGNPHQLTRPIRPIRQGGVGVVLVVAPLRRTRAVLDRPRCQEVATTTTTTTTTSSTGDRDSLAPIAADGSGIGLLWRAVQPIVEMHAVRTGVVRAQSEPGNYIDIDDARIRGFPFASKLITCNFLCCDLLNTRTRAHTQKHRPRPLSLVPYLKSPTLRISPDELVTLTLGVSVSTSQRYCVDLDSTFPAASVAHTSKV